MQLKLLIKLLKSLDFQGKTAKNGQEAVDLVKNEGFDICFMDIQMPVMDGIEATKIIKQDLKKTMPVIAVTSIDGFSHEKSIAAGLDGYLKKPVDLNHLKQVIEKYCRA